MTQVSKSNSSKLRARTSCRRVIWTSIWLLLIVGGPWRAQAGAVGLVTDDNVAERVAAAKTPQDHEALVAYYRAQAAAKTDQVKRHEAMLKSYDNVAGTSKELMRNHCQMLISSYRQAQRALEGLAQEHENLAKAAEHTHSGHTH